MLNKWKENKEIFLKFWNRILTYKKYTKTTVISTVVVKNLFSFADQFLMYCAKHVKRNQRNHFFAGTKKVRIFQGTRKSEFFQYTYAYFKRIGVLPLKIQFYWFHCVNWCSSKRNTLLRLTTAQFLVERTFCRAFEPNTHHTVSQYKKISDLYTKHAAYTQHSLFFHKTHDIFVTFVFVLRMSFDV